MNIKNHFYLRYVQRIEGIEDEKEAKQYIAMNKEILTEKINRMYENSRRIYKGQIGDNITRVFNIVDNIILVINSTEDALITLYRVDFGFNDKINRSIVKELIEELEQLEQKKQEEEAKTREYIEQRTIYKNNIELRIKVLLEELKNLQDQKKVVEADIEYALSTVQSLNKKIEHTANMLCNSLEYKRELKAIGA
jgi:hypothetical protein